MGEDDVQRVKDGLARMGAAGFARALGIRKVQPDGNRSVRVPCPVHNGKNPNCKITVKAGDLVFYCFNCKATGDSLKLLQGIRNCSFKDALTEGAIMAGVMLDGAPPNPEKARIAKAERAQFISQNTPAEPPKRLPASELETFWEGCTRACDSTAVSGWLADRQIEPDTVSDLDIVRALGEVAPSWAAFRGQSWEAHRYLVVGPLYDSVGELRGGRGGTIHTRAAIERGALAEGLPKRLSPAGGGPKGLVMACPTAQAMLRGTAAPSTVVVAEGEPDFLTWAARELNGVATIGIVSGSWGSDIAARIPDGTIVSVVTDDDGPGEKYAAEIYRTVADRCTVLRDAPTEAGNK